MDIPLTLYAWEVPALEAGNLLRLIRSEVASSHHDRDGLIYTFGDRRFALSKWRCHRPEVSDSFEPGFREPLTTQQLAEAGMTPELFADWYQGVLERAAAFADPFTTVVPPDVWLATIEPLEEEQSA